VEKHRNRDQLALRFPGLCEELGQVWPLRNHGFKT
jgi:hypothetical protein